jgi:hypothetical protein
MVQAAKLVSQNSNISSDHQNDNNDYKSYNDYKLALCEFSIDIESKGKFVVAYRELTFDPVKKAIQISKKTHFNSNFYSQMLIHSFLVVSKIFIG